MDAVVLAGLPTELPLKMFHEVLRVLVPGGMVQTSYLVSEHTIAKTEETVNSDLLMGGFVGSASVISTLRSQASVRPVCDTTLKPRLQRNALEAQGDAISELRPRSLAAGIPGSLSTGASGGPNTAKRLGSLACRTKALPTVPRALCRSNLGVR